MPASFRETAEKEVQDISCRGSGGVPQLQESPKIGGFRGLIETISAISFIDVDYMSDIGFVEIGRIARFGPRIRGGKSPHPERQRRFYPPAAADR